MRSLHRGQVIVELSCLDESGSLAKVGNMEKQLRMSKADFELAKHKLGRLSLNTIKLAELIIVEGQIPAAAAKVVGMSRQNVSKSMQRVYAALSDVPDGWVRLECWAPKDLADQLLKQVEDAKKQQQ
jgi:hypothetical protein